MTTAKSNSRIPDISQSIIGLGLFVLIAGALVALFAWAIFYFKITLATIWLAPLIIAIECWLLTGVFIVAHDAMHSTLSPRWPTVNNAVGAIILFLYAGFVWTHFRAAHLAHHISPGGSDDPDFNPDNPVSFWPWYVRFFKTYFGLKSVVFVTVVVWGFILFLNAPILNVILFYGAASILSSAQLFYFGTYLPHRHSGAFLDAHKARSNDYPAWLSLLTCYHFGYHHEHHLAPNVPWWQLPRERRKRRTQAGLA